MKLNDTQWFFVMFFGVGITMYISSGKDVDWLEVILFPFLCAFLSIIFIPSQEG